MKRLVAAAVLVVAVVVAWPVPASAHPLGNFTVNTYSGLRVMADRVEVDLVVDMAEIPAFQVKVTPEYGREQCAAHLRRAALSVDGRPAPLDVTATSVETPPGQGGLNTLRLTCRMAAATDLRAEHTIRYRSDVHTDRIGWREITAVGDGASIVAGDVPAVSVSAALTAYPDDLLQSPLDQREALLRVRPGGGAAPVSATGALERAGGAFTDLVARRDLTAGFALVAVGIALVLGGVHAFAPGHGKTMMAAYLVGQRGSLRQAAVMGATVTVTHTAGVLVLGLVLTATTGFAPERLYPWLGLASGVLVIGIGVGLLRRAHRTPAPHDHQPVRQLVTVGGGHSHTHEHGHHHHAHPHPHEQGMSRRSLLAVGLAGGMVPTPSALVVLLGAIALGRAWFGVVLVIAYGVGMAAALIGTGLLLVRARGFIEQRMARRRPDRLVGLTHLLPVVTATVIVVVGLFLAVRSAAAI